jgi:hypothetical protein
VLGSLEEAALNFDAVTTYAHRHWESHARRCVESFNKFWRGTPLWQFDDALLEERSAWLADFKRRHAHRPTGNYRMDAVRFAHKVAAIELAFYAGTADALVWIDADCVTHAAVDHQWLKSLLGDADFAYLRRANKYPECGFMLFRRSDAGMAFVDRIVEKYRDDTLFALPEWHDSFVIDFVREQRGSRLRSVSLSGTAESTGHPLVNGPLGEKLDHLKGKRKVTGRSHAADLKIHRTEGYWRGQTV